MVTGRTPAQVLLGRASHTRLSLFHPCLSRLTVVSREAKKKQHACASSGPRDHYSEYLHGWQL